MSFPNSTHPYGPVNIIYDGVAGGVCGDGWDDKAAQVTCKSIGYKDGKVNNTYANSARER